MAAPKGPASISVLLLPSPSVVAGDVMRDSNGVPAPLSIVAYDAGGAPIPGLTTQFFITDSVIVAHVDGSGVLVGDKIGTVHLLGQIGALQTGIATVPVTPTPAKFAKSATGDSLLSPLGADSSSSIGTFPLGVTLRSAGDSGVASFVVKYRILRAPLSKSATSPAVYILGRGGKIGTADTTDQSGAAGPSLAVNSFFLADTALVLGNKVDSAIVQASTFYKGLPVSGSPVTFVVRIFVKLPF